MGTWGLIVLFAVMLETYCKVSEGKLSWSVLLQNNLRKEICLKFAENCFQLEVNAFQGLSTLIKFS